MEHTVFIHGSSEGQSTLIPSECPSIVCNEIANKYFQGRILRQKNSNASLCLFVELYRSISGETFCAYTFINNQCLSSKERRTGQYFAITILNKDAYVFPESIFRMLNSAYRQMFDTGKILRKNNDGNNQFVIAQFSEEKEYFNVLLAKIDNAFHSIVHGQGKSIAETDKSADYDLWMGIKVNIDNCNSISTYYDFCHTGRLYISEEYESQLETIKKLKAQIQHLESEKREYEERSNNAKQSEKLKNKKEIEGLESQIKQKEALITNLQNENDKFRTSIDLIGKELDKFSRANKAVTDNRDDRSNKKDLLNICLLLLILILTAISCFFNYSLFRNNHTPLFVETTKEKKQGHVYHDETSANHPKLYETNDKTFTIFPDVLNANNKREEYTIEISGNIEWNAPSSSLDWVSFKKKDDNHLIITLEDNNLNTERTTTILINDRQLSICQEGKNSSSETTPDFGLVVFSDSQQETIIHPNSTVYPGQIIYASVSRPSLAANGYGWTYLNCNGDKRNVKASNITINGAPGQTATFGYGPLGTDPSKRQRVSFRIEARSLE